MNKFNLKFSIASLIICAITLLCIFIFSPSTQKRLGDLFFNGASMIYNVPVAKWLYTRSVNPIFGSIPSGGNYQLSRIYFIQGDLTQAVVLADKELELYPENCRTHYIRGLTYAYMNDLDNAIEDFKTFNASCVKNSWAGHNDLAWFYFQKGDMVNMLKTIEEVVPMYMSNPWVQNSYGIALLNTGKYEDAVKAFTIALQVANLMTESDWGTAYPGNNPKIYGRGLATMRENIESNLKLAEEKAKGRK